MTDDFVGLVAHELRTPLTSILGYVEELRSGEPGPLTDLQRQFLEIIDRNGARLLALVEDLVFLGRPSLELAPVDLGDVAAGVPGVELERNGAVSVEGDAARLAQLVQSLVVVTAAQNVRVHSDGREAVLEVAGTTEPASTAGARLVLAIADAIADAHHGVIEGDGAALRLRIPLAEARHE